MVCLSLISSMRPDPDPLAVLAHRPYPLPQEPWVMAQVWHELLFAHWSFEPRALRALVPETLELDLWQGRAFLGVVPFRMSGVRLRCTPALLWLSAFAELNLRTYVSYKGKAGVFFFSLDAANPIAVRVARAWFHLPYFDARMRCMADSGGVRYQSERTHRRAAQARLRVDYRATGPVTHARAGTLEHWLTERYGLYTTNRSGALLHAEIHHIPWPLQSAQATWYENTMTAALGLELSGPPLCHYAQRLDVRCYAPRRIQH